ncbi:biotin--[acetyl-CoA-carboxylase] ligase, partial [Candidatus Atribacteria bacterium HGW-Atribacteria-1]
ELKSTNIMAKEKALHRAEEIDEGTLITAERQSAGKGRLGREWFSPVGGIWLSIILYPKLSPSYISRITLMTAVAVVKAIKICTQIESQIKWPNDILINEKKVCGILTEMSAELDIINWVVVGIGINVNIDHREFPEDIQENTISLKEILGKEVLRVKLVQVFLQEFEKYYESLKRREFSSILKEWKLYSHTLGRKIRVDMGERIIAGEAVDINEEGALILKKEDGQLVEIISGTII